MAGGVSKWERKREQKLLTRLKGKGPAGDQRAEDRHRDRRKKNKNSGKKRSHSAVTMVIPQQVTNLPSRHTTFYMISGIPLNDLNTLDATNLSVMHVWHRIILKGSFQRQ